MTSRSPASARSTPSPTLLRSPRCTCNMERECNSERCRSRAYATWSRVVVDLGLRQEVPR